jgi:hypothetical protein
MTWREIPFAEWGPFLEQFSHQHHAWIAEVESSVAGDAVRQAATRRFIGARLCVENNHATGIELRFHREDDGQDTVRVSPGTLRAEETTEGASQGLEIETQDAERIRVQFRGTSQPNVLLDGIAPGELS